jgi:hypothetical protein
LIGRAGLVALALLALPAAARAQDSPFEDDPKLSQPPAAPPPQPAPYYQPPPPPAPPPAPPIQPVRYETRRPNVRMVTEGFIAFGGIWVSSVLLAYLNGDGLLAVPIYGPFYYGLKVFNSGPAGQIDGALFMLEGVGSAVALGIGIAGLFMTRKVPIQAALAPTPGGATLAIGGSY